MLWLMGADLIAFHTHDYMRHFVSAAERVLDLRFKLDQVQIGNRTIFVDAFPMGINYDLYSDGLGGGSGGGGGGGV
jgi:trehalose 6-phosphate synthase/phosphatase